MRKTTIHCDHCGKILDEMHDWVDIEIAIGSYTGKADLCKECLDTLYARTNHFLSNGKQNDFKE